MSGEVLIKTNSNNSLQLSTQAKLFLLQPPLINGRLSSNSCAIHKGATLAGEVLQCNNLSVLQQNPSKLYTGSVLAPWEECHKTPCQIGTKRCKWGWPSVTTELQKVASQVHTNCTMLALAKKSFVNTSFLSASCLGTGWVIVKFGGGENSGAIHSVGHCRTCLLAVLRVVQCALTEVD